MGPNQDRRNSTRECVCGSETKGVRGLSVGCTTLSSPGWSRLGVFRAATAGYVNAIQGARVSSVASIRHEVSPMRWTRRPAKFSSLQLCTLNLAQLGLHDPADLFHIFHRHQIIYVESQPKSLLQAARQRHVSHGVPGWDVARYGIDGNGLRINVERRLECGAYFFQQSFHVQVFPNVIECQCPPAARYC